MFEDNQIFCWDTQIGRGIDSSYTQDVMKAYRKHLMVKKAMQKRHFIIWDSSILQKLSLQKIR